MIKQYQVSPAHYVGGHVSGEILSLESSDPQTVSWLNAGAITENIDSTLEPTFEPNAGAFYHEIQASQEFHALDSWAILNAVEPAATLLSRAMSVVLESKAYSEQFGGKATSFEAVEARLNQFISSLNEATDYGGTDKAAIVLRVNAAITSSKIPVSIG
jgi:hypothetical protein